MPTEKGSQAKGNKPSQPKANKPEKEEKREWSNIEGSKGLRYVTSEKNDNVMIVFDASKDFGMSGSGKTLIIATCGRPKEITLNDGSTIFLNLTAYKYPTPK